MISSVKDNKESIDYLEEKLNDLIRKNDENTFKIIELSDMSEIKKCKNEDFNINT